MAERARLDRGSQPLLLLVDDHRDTAVSAGRLLATCGFRVEVARGGEAGIRKAQAVLPDIIVTDLVMPTTSGITLCRELKQSSKTRNIPIIVYTAVSDVPMLAPLHGLGVLVFAIKPCIPTVIAEEARALLEADSTHPARLRVVTGYGDSLDHLAAQIREASGVGT
jgi:two-component system phosphate regulon response regulator PhoB